MNEEAYFYVGASKMKTGVVHTPSRDHTTGVAFSVEYRGVEYKIPTASGRGGCEKAYVV